MAFLSKGIGNRVLAELGKAAQTRLAVAFFNPNDTMLAALAKAPRLRLVISEEFTINDPYKLETLGASAVRSMPPDAEGGKLHAKVLHVTRQDGSCWALVGSANMT